MNPVMAPYLDYRALNAIFDPLILLDDDSQELTQDGVVESWERVDETTWRFRVREGLAFHNGDALTAESVRFSILESRDNPSSIQRSFYDIVADAEVVDGEVEVTTSQPYAALPALMSATAVLPEKYYQEVGAEGFATKPIGSGPYRFSSLSSGQSLTVSRNDDYWRGKPGFEGMVFTWNPDATARHNLLVSGDADFVYDLAPQFLESVAKTNGYKVVTGESGYRMLLFLDTNQGAFTDPALREAVSMAIDRDGVVNALFQGEAVASNQFIGDLMNEPAELPAEFDVAGAKAALQASGASPRIVLGHTIGKSAGDSQLGPAVAGMLKEAGFDVQLQGEEYGRFRELRDAGSFDAFLFETLPIFRHPDALASYYVGSGAPVAMCPDAAEYDAMLTDALASSTPEESDAGFARIEKRAVEQDICMVPLYRTVYSYGLTEDIRGFNRGPVDVVPDYFLMSWATDS